jgi:hypothetical protein
MTVNCGIREIDGSGCSNLVVENSALNLCTIHLLAAYDQVSAEFGITDALPSPCLACGSRLGVRYPSGWLCAICEWRLGETPDSDAKSARVDVVYYIRLKDKVKIGTSANPRSRLAQLPWDEVLAFERGNRQREQLRHQQFGSHRIAGGEWFWLHDELASHIHALQAGVTDPWSSYSLWVSQVIALNR